MKTTTTIGLDFIPWDYFLVKMLRLIQRDFNQRVNIQVSWKIVHKHRKYSTITLSIHFGEGVNLLNYLVIHWYQGALHQCHKLESIGCGSGGTARGWTHVRPHGSDALVARTGQRSWLPPGWASVQTSTDRFSWSYVPTVQGGTAHSGKLAAELPEPRRLPAIYLRWSFAPLGVLATDPEKVLAFVRATF